MLRALIKNLVPGRYKKTVQFMELYDQMTYKKDGLYTIHNCSYADEPGFRNAYSAGKATGSWGAADLEWRVHTVLWAAKKAFAIEGDFVECGVNKGGYSKAIVDYLDFRNSGKKFFLLDTFGGFDNDLLLESEKKKYRDLTIYKDVYEEVKNTFKDIPNVQIIKGAVPYTLPQVTSEKVAYLSIDMNCAQPETEALNFFWPKLVKGGIVVLDDFAYSGFEEQYVAHTAWAKQNKIDILTLPTGQGLMIKP